MYKSTTFKPYNNDKKINEIKNLECSEELKNFQNCIKYKDLTKQDCNFQSYKLNLCLKEK